MEKGARDSPKTTGVNQFPGEEKWPQKRSLPRRDTQRGPKKEALDPQKEGNLGNKKRNTCGTKSRHKNLENCEETWRKLGEENPGT